MAKREMNAVAVLLVFAWSCASATSSMRVTIDLETFGGALATPTDRSLLFGWQLPPVPEAALQTAYELNLTANNGHTVWVSGVILSNRSDGISYSGPTLAAGQRFCAQVSSHLKGATGDARRTVSGEQCFYTAPLLQTTGARPVWAANSTQQLVMLRGSFSLTATDQHVLHISAKPVPVRLWCKNKGHGGSNASKLLGAYKVWLNGLPLAAGPGRPTGASSTEDHPALLYDSVAVGAKLLRVGQNTIAIEAFYWNQHQEPEACLDPQDLDDRGGVLALLLNANGAVITGTGTKGEWLSFKHSDVMMKTNQGLVASTDGRYQQPVEAWDTRAAPTTAGLASDWRDPQFIPQADQWNLAAPRSPPSNEGAFAALHSKRALHNALVSLPVSSISQTPTVPPSPGRAPSITRLRAGVYVVDLGRERQGGLNLTITAVTDGASVRAFGGEELLLNGTVKRRGTSSNINDAVWVLRRGWSRIVTHEYFEARFWQLESLEFEAVDFSVDAWYVMYAGVVVEGAPGQTQFSSESAALDEVWELSKFTLRTGTMDVNTDSNTRQRDNCNLDSALQSAGQAAVAPAAALRYLRRNARFLNEGDADVHGWSEFELSTLFAVYEYTIVSGDTAVAREFYEHLLQNCSLLQFVDQKLGLVNKPPQLAGYQNLIDWPDAPDALHNSSCCRDGYQDGNISTVINAHVVRAARRLAELGTLIGRPQHEIRALKATANRIASQLLQAAVLESFEACGGHPPCFRDSTATTHAASPATMYALACEVLPANETARFLPFLMARNVPTPQFSAQSASWMFEALFRMSSATGNKQAADWGFQILTSNGHRSWREMIAHGASMTIEHWYGVSYNKHTWSHPWSATPAAAIVRWLMGVRALEPAFRRVSVHPQPPTNNLLPSAQLSMPTARGDIVVSFVVKEGSYFLLNVTLPGNTRADVCVPAWLVSSSSDVKACLSLNGVAESGVWRGGMLCLSDDLHAGTSTVLATPCKTSTN